MAGKLPTLKARQLMRVLHSLGFQPVRQVGSHIFYKHSDGRTTVIPRHDREDIGKALLKEILKDIHISPDEFMEHL